MFSIGDAYGALKFSVTHGFELTYKYHGWTFKVAYYYILRVDVKKLKWTSDRK